MHCSVLVSVWPPSVFCPLYIVAACVSMCQHVCEHGFWQCFQCLLFCPVGFCTIVPLDCVSRSTVGLLQAHPVQQLAGETDALKFCLLHHKP